ncbi:hypothetical protein [Actinomyces bovis]|nr:hypothetical protein [Actinomyces bovis]
MRISYNPSPYLPQGRTGLLSEAQTREKWSQRPGFEQLDLGLDGHAYFLPLSVYHPLEADAAWFAPDGRTLQVELLQSSTPAVTEQEGKTVVVALLRYAASIYPSTFPTVQPTPTPQ